MEAIQEKSLKHETKTIAAIKATTPFEELDESAKLAIRLAGEKKAFNIVALDLREIASFAEFFIVAGGSNQRQVQAIADEISEQLKKHLRVSPSRIEGYRSAEWILLDYGDFIVHVFEEKARGFYDLENLWRDAKRVEIPADI